MTARTSQQIRNYSVAAGSITTVMAVIVIMSTAGKEYSVLQSVSIGLSIGVVVGLVALFVAKTLNK